MKVFHDDSGDAQGSHPVVPIVPASWFFHLDTEVIDLLAALRKKRSPRRERISLDYLEVKESLGRCPTYQEAHLFGTIKSKEYRRQAFGGYFAFLYDHGELRAHEKVVYEKHYAWLTKVEKEMMTKSYKMVVLAYLLDKGPFDWNKGTVNELISQLVIQKHCGSMSG